jgi:hypothetical protein
VDLYLSSCTDELVHSKPLPRRDDVTALHRQTGVEAFPEIESGQANKRMHMLRFSTYRWLLRS